MEVLIAEKHARANLEETLLRVVDSSKIGRRLLGFAVQKLMASSIARACDEAGKKL